jgi:hypothetical protein
MPSPKNWRPVVLALVLFALNAYVCRELFTAEFIHNLDSNEGVFVSISRFFRTYGLTQGWYPWFNTGMPIENAYQPLLPVLAALAGKLTGWSVEHAFHFVLAMAYCSGPVALFCFAWEWSESLATGFIAGLAYSLYSPAELLIPVLRLNAEGHYGPLRLFNLIHYAEDPHNLALSLLPLALLFLHRVIVRPGPTNAAGAAVSCAAVVLANAFGAVDLAIGGLCIVLAVNHGFRALFLTGIAAYLLMCPWLPPSLINHIRNDQWGALGQFQSGPATFLTYALTIAAFFLLRIVTRRLSGSLHRFAILFALWMCVIPLGYFLLDLTLVPQGSRYQLELEMALCLAFACLCARLPWRPVVIAVILIAGVRQTIVFRRFARSLIQPVDITQTIQYKNTMWMNRHLPGQRAMISGDVEFLYNILSDNPQFGGGHEPTAPNWVQRFAVYTIYSGAGAGDRDAEYSLFWLKAFGNQAITVPGAKSRETYHPVAHPHKFDGVLPVLWHDEDDTIFAVPQRSPSLAHVIPRSAVTARAPVHGLDIDPVRPYVAALDDASLPLAALTWVSPSHAVIDAPVKSGQELSVQVTYMPGWRAHTNAGAVPVRKDGIGLIVIDPQCDGPCHVDLSFGPNTEDWICRALSALVAVTLTVLTAPGIFAAIRKAPLRQPSRH